MKIKVVAESIFYDFFCYMYFRLTLFKIYYHFIQKKIPINQSTTLEAGIAHLVPDHPLIKRRLIRLRPVVKRSVHISFFHRTQNGYFIFSPPQERSVRSVVITHR